MMMMMMMMHSHYLRSRAHFFQQLNQVLMRSSFQNEFKRLCDVRCIERWPWRIWLVHVPQERTA